MSTTPTPTYPFLPEGTPESYAASAANARLHFVHTMLCLDYEIEPSEAITVIRAWAATQQPYEIAAYGEKLDVWLIAKHADLTLRQTDFVGE